MIEVERRANPPSVAQFFRITKGIFLSNEEYVEHMRTHRCLPGVVEYWQEVHGKRGNHHVHLVVNCGGLVRQNSFGVVDDLSLFRYACPEISALVATAWDRALMLLIEQGPRGFLF